MKRYVVIFIWGFLILSHSIDASSKNKNSNGWDKEEVDKILQETKDTLKINIQEAKNIQETASSKKNQRKGSGKIQPITNQKNDTADEEIKLNFTSEIPVIKEENECPFQKYNYVFTTRWTQKSIALNEFQHTSLGVKNYPFSDYVKAEYYIKNIAQELDKCPDKINGKTNLSVLRCVVKAISYSLIKNDFTNIRNLLDLCALKKVDFWTSPSIDKDTVEKNKNDNNLTSSTSNITQEKNKVQSLFKATRKNLFGLINQQIDLFIKNVNPEVIDIKKIANDQPIIFPDAIDKIKELYILTVMTHNIHEKQFLDYESISQQFKDIDEKNILNLVAPDKVPHIEQIKNIFANMKKASEDTEKAKKTLLSSTKYNNIEESTLSLGQNS